MKTKYLDANLILRLIVKDNQEHLEQIYALFTEANHKKSKLFGSTLVIFETEWVLRSFYQFKKEDVVLILQKILLIQEINFENSLVLDLALQKMLTNSLGIEDNYHLAFCQINQMDLVTFDKKLQKLSKNK